MTRRELIEKYYDELREEIIDCYRCVLKCWRTGINYQVYIWEDGEFEFLEQVNPGTGWLHPNQCESRELYYICTVSESGFNPWDGWCEEYPNDETEEEKIEKELIDECVDWWVGEGKADELIEEAMKEKEGEMVL